MTGRTLHIPSELRGSGACSDKDNEGKRGRRSRKPESAKIAGKAKK
jgi:hypothetical protein